jgi:hypothetical protein
LTTADEAEHFDFNLSEAKPYPDRRAIDSGQSSCIDSRLQSLAPHVYSQHAYYHNFDGLLDLLLLEISRLITSPRQEKRRMILLRSIHGAMSTRKVVEMRWSQHKSLQVLVYVLLVDARTWLIPVPQNLGGNDPALSKAAAGKGNVVNPLELSPATPELSKTLEDKVCFYAFFPSVVFHMLTYLRMFRRVKREMLANTLVKESVEKRKRSRSRNWTSRNE